MTDPSPFLDKKTFSALFTSEFKGLVFFAIGYVKDADAAKDIVHDAFLILWEKRETIDLSKPVKSYLSTIVRNKCLNFLRDNRKFDKDIINLEDHFAAEAYEPPDKLSEAETRRSIDSAIAELPEKCREIFILNRFENKKYKEIAEGLGISVKTVETQMSKALEHMRRKVRR